MLTVGLWFSFFFPFFFYNYQLCWTLFLQKESAWRIYQYVQTADHCNVAVSVGISYIKRCFDVVSTNVRKPYGPTDTMFYAGKFTPKWHRRISRYVSNHNVRFAYDNRRIRRIEFRWSSLLARNS